MRLKNGLLSLILLGIGTFGNAACRCPMLSDQERQDQAEFIFTGQVSELRRDKASGRTKVIFDVENHIKGDTGDEFRLVDIASGTECGTEFKERQFYAVFAKWQWGDNVTSQCMGTHRLDPASADAQSVGPVDKDKDKMYDRLEVHCMGKPGTSCCLNSVKAMRKGYYLPEPPAGGCPSGFVPDQLRCLQSYRWCIPASDPAHRESVN